MCASLNLCTVECGQGLYAGIGRDRACEDRDSPQEMVMSVT